jgi:hypothetical protein
MTVNEPVRHDPAVAGAIARLTIELHGVVRPAVVRRMVVGCRHELAGVPTGAMPELLERLARHRLVHADRSHERARSAAGRAAS